MNFLSLCFVDSKGSPPFPLQLLSKSRMDFLHNEFQNFLVDQENNFLDLKKIFGKIMNHCLNSNDWQLLTKQSKALFLLLLDHRRLVKYPTTLPTFHVTFTRGEGYVNAAQIKGSHRVDVTTESGEQRSC